MHSPHWGENRVTTWSPSDRSLTSEPHRSTTPAPSCPRTVGAYPEGSTPEAVYMSVWHTPQATRRTSTSLGPGSASSTSPTTSGLPNSSRTAARIFIAQRGPPATPRRRASGWWRSAISTSASSPGGREAGEVDDLVVARPAAELLGVGPRGPFHEHLERPPHEPLGTLACPASGRPRRSRSIRSTFTGWGTSPSVISAAAVPRRAENRNVKALSKPTSLDHLEGLGEVLLGLPGKADDDVGADGHVGERARGSGPRGRGTAAGRRSASSPSGSGSTPTAAAGGCARTRSASSAWARITSSRMSFGWGLV